MLLPVYTRTEINKTALTQNKLGMQMNMIEVKI